jgi:hypothetical protein
MVCYQTKKPNFGKFWRASEWKMLTYFMAIWESLCPFGTFCVDLVHFSVLVFRTNKNATLVETIK